jgi:DNA polymerase-1
VVHTLLGRGSPVPTGPSAEGGSAEDQARHRRAWGRFTRNFVVQGTGAEWALCWLADLRNRLWRLGSARSPGSTPADRPHLVFFLHDEVVVHTPAELADDVTAAVRSAAAEAGRLLYGSFPVDFPLDVSVVDSWADA